MNKSRKTLLMSTVAVALIAGVGLAFAQAPAPGASQPAPVERTAPAPTPDGAANSKTPAAAAKPGRADVKMDRNGAKAQSAQDNAKDGVMPRGGTTSKDSTAENPKSQNRSHAGTQQDRSRAGANAEPRTNNDARGSERTGSEQMSDRNGGAKFDPKDRASANRSDRLSGEQRSTIRTVIARQNVEPTSHVNFALAVGTRVPRTVHFNSVPVELVAIYPRWRGYEYVLVGDQILVVNPRTHKIVAILDA
jgi:hypothetical protein